MREQLEHIVTEVGALILAGKDQGLTGPQADRMAHEELSRRLIALDGRIPVLSEEGEDFSKEARPERYWLIDPIDGTASYAKGFPGYVTQVALIERRRPVLAAIRAPALELTYSAERRKGATLNGRKLALPPKNALEVLIDNYPEPRGKAAEAFRELRFKRYVESGSISLKMCRVADGTADLFFKDLTVRDWDLAAPHLVLEEAGGMLCKLNGGAFAYEGPVEHTGLVAARSEKAARDFVSWYKRKP
jgi:fructose-1,6-bisphosphatase/inositol monophosphatase family enzyme